MGKVKTLNRQRISSKNTSKKTYRLKKGVRVSTHNPLKTLTNEKLIAQAFWECLRDNDPEGALEVLNAHLNALNKM